MSLPLNDLLVIRARYERWKAARAAASPTAEARMRAEAVPEDGLVVR